MTRRAQIMAGIIGSELFFAARAWADIAPPDDIAERAIPASDAVRTSWSPGIALFLVAAVLIFVFIHKSRKA